MENIILGLLRLFCPQLKDMAKRTANPVDDFVVNIICASVNAPDPNQVTIKKGP